MPSETLSEANGIFDERETRAWGISMGELLLIQGMQKK